MSPTSSIDSSDSESKEVSQSTNEYQENEVAETVAGNAKETPETIVSLTNNDKDSASIAKINKDDYRKRKGTKRKMPLSSSTIKRTLRNSEVDT